MRYTLPAHISRVRLPRCLWFAARVCRAGVAAAERAGGNMYWVVRTGCRAFPGL